VTIRFLLAVFAATPLLVNAGDQDLPSSSDGEGEKEVDVIVVTASRMDKTLNSIAGAASVVSSEAVQHARQQLSLDESMARVPGMFFQNRYNSSQDLRISIRGFGSRSNFGVRGIKILVDDVPETLADGQTQVDSIDLGSVKRIEVLRGPSSALYGNAAGGVINITSETGSAEPFVEARLSFGEYGFSKHQIKAAGGSDRLDYMFNVSQLDFDGHRAHSVADNTQLNSRVTYRPDDLSEFGFVFNHTDQPVSDDAGSLTREEAQLDPRQARGRNVDFDAGEALDQQKIGITYKRETANGGKFMARNYYLWRDFANKLPFASGGAVQFERFFAGVGANYMRALPVASYDNNIVIGFDFDRQDDDRKRFDNNDGVIGNLTFDQNETVTSTGVYVQDQLSISEDFEISLGVRYDRVNFDLTDRFLSDGDNSGSRYLDEISPMLGAVMDVTPNLNLYATVSSSFQTPTSTEFANPDGSGGFNQNLEPQLATNFEIGVRGQLSNQQRFELAAFTIDVKDELIPFETAASPGRDFYANAGRSTRDGIEFSYSAEPTPSLSWIVSYTYSDFTFDQFTDDNGNNFAGNRLPGIADHSVFAEIVYKHSKGAYGAIDVQYVDELFANNANTETIDAYTLTSLRVGFDKSIGSFELGPFVGVHNLFDEAYTANVRINAFGGRFFEPGPGRNAYAGISIRYGFD
jgi:iron complex outermembrane receptor protein